jgi:hypothetical protein
VDFLAVGGDDSDSSLGSYVAISHMSEDGRPPAGQRDAQKVYARADAVIMRSH